MLTNIFMIITLLVLDFLILLLQKETILQPTASANPVKKLRRTKSIPDLIPKSPIFAFENTTFYNHFNKIMVSYYVTLSICIIENMTDYAKGQGAI